MNYERNRDALIPAFNNSIPVFSSQSRMGANRANRAHATFRVTCWNLRVRVVGQQAFVFALTLFQHICVCT